MIEQVSALIREAATEVVLPMFRRLSATDVTEKAPGEVVTVADQRTEEVLSAGLTALLPGSVVVGEEGVAADPALLARLRGSDPVWVVDPIDGTANYAAGRTPFAIMVALVRDGTTVAGWIHDPVGDSLTVAEAGSGAYVDGVRMRISADPPPPGGLRGPIMTRFFPPGVREAFRERASVLGEVLPGVHCAGREYADLVAGVQHFAVFWRTLPWDHVAGSFLVREAGGVACRLDGSPYEASGEGSGLVAAASEQIWHEVREVLRTAGV
ncbi:inositol monophosphatase [Polymorphospora sp. NPDC051019]|uniref:inositol monophosphatase family protein n=1 Tax=Polymorphospora sp. NPDC051019 TaxID=3155725 RepID=UPI003417FB98